MGDGLLNLSYGLMGRMRHPRALSLVRMSSHLLGPKGLILGQNMDLSGEMSKGPAQLLLTHELKTSRLLQAALIGGVVLGNAPGGLPTVKAMHRLGRDLGLAFQLLDDLQELGASHLSPHEAEVNPWPRFPEECFRTLLACLESCRARTNDMPRTRAFLNEYWEGALKALSNSQSQILEHAPHSELGTILQALGTL